MCHGEARSILAVQCISHFVAQARCAKCLSTGIRDWRTVDDYAIVGQLEQGPR